MGIMISDNWDGFGKNHRMAKTSVNAKVFLTLTACFSHLQREAGGESYTWFVMSMVDSMSIEEELVRMGF